MNITAGPLVMVEWRDAAGGVMEGWRSMVEVKRTAAAPAVSIGFLVHRDDDKVVICPHVAHKGDSLDGDGEIAIPLQWIDGIWELRKGKKVKI